MPVVRAEIELLPTEFGGRSGPAMGDYRPSHDFGFATGFAIGRILLDHPLAPGDRRDVELAFLDWPELADALQPGREWTIREGLRVVGRGRVLG